MATVMPPADTRLPLRAVAGEFIRDRPMTNATAPDQPGDPDEDLDDLERRHGCRPPRRRSPGLGAAGFFRNIWSIRSVTT